MLSLGSAPDTPHAREEPVITTVGRNDPCPCGSGEKYKRCCEPKAGARSNRRALLIALGIVGAAGAIWVAVSMLTETPLPSRVAPSGQTPITTGTLTPQPPGPVPPGKVWSPEHGHWHDAPIDPTAAPVPQPPGPAPAGKVWSPEHGHWHDVTPGDTSAPGGTGTGATATP